MGIEVSKTSSILVVDDEESNVVLLCRMLRHAGYTNTVGVTDPRTFWEVFDSLHPDLVLLDMHMPYIDGLQILSGLATSGVEDEFLPVLVLTADVSPETRQRALTMGAQDFVTKPFDALEVLLRVRNLLYARGLNVRLRDQRESLDRKVVERTRDLEAAHIDTVERLAIAAEHRDSETGEHIRTVGAIAGLLAAELGMEHEQAELVRLAAPLHDVGKIGLPDSVLVKPGRLTPEEILLMRDHTRLGEKILARARTPLMETARVIALTHHERWDGTGYPNGIAGDDIPLAGRITAVSDVFDALTRARRYKDAWPLADAVEEIKRGYGSHFDPIVVEAFVHLVEGGKLEKANPELIVPASALV